MNRNYHYGQLVVLEGGMEFVSQLWSAAGYIARVWRIVSVLLGLIVGLAAIMEGAPFALAVLIALAAIAILMLIAALKEWNTRIRNRGFEISGPECLTDNRNTERQEAQLCRVKIKNIAGKPLKNCQVRMISMTDKDGKESREVGRHLWLSNERGSLDPQGKHPRHRKRFDMSVDGEEWVDVAYLDPADPTKIRICYARDEQDEGVFINFGGVASHAPYKLTVSVTSDDCREERLSFQYWVNDEGTLLVEGIGNGSGRTAESKRAAVF